MYQAAYGGFFVIDIRPSPQIVFSELVYLLDNCFGQEKSAHSISWEGILGAGAVQLERERRRC